jgi:hypothetical protein
MNVFWQKVINMLASKEDTSAESALAWIKAAEQAKLDWINALMYFETVTDNDLIDYAIYMIMANERRYMYIVNKIRRFENYPPSVNKAGDNHACVRYNRYIMTGREGDVYDSGF